MTAASEKAIRLVNDWTEHTQLPMTDEIAHSLARLGNMVSEAIDDAEHDAYTRVLRDVAEFLDQEPRDQIQSFVASRIPTLSTTSPARA